MSEITPFNFPDTMQTVRTVVRDGEPWWNAADVGAVLELSNIRESLRGLDEDEKSTTTADTPGGAQEMTIISESGLYSLILRSRKPQAKAFKRWITHEVIPAIRKTGSYGVAERESAPGGSLVQQLEMMLEVARGQEQQKLELAAVKAETAILSSKMESVEGKFDEFAVLGYAKLNGYPTDRVTAQKVGKTATRLMRNLGLKPRTRQDATFGEINIYPVKFLEEAFALHGYQG